MVSAIRVDAEWHSLDAVAVVSPAHFRLTEPINRTQQRFYNTPFAPSAEGVGAEHENVLRELAAAGIQVVVLPPAADLPYQFNVRDAGVVIGNELVLARMARSVRAAEPASLRAALEHAASLVELESGCLEGGDLVVTPREVFVGIGERTTEEGCESLAKHLAEVRQVTPIALAEGVLHLDVAMGLLGPNLGVLHQPSIVSYLPDSLREVEWIRITDEEFSMQAANVLVLKPGVVLLDVRHERLRADLTARGYRCVAVDLTEITRVGGGIRCMTLPLVRTNTG